MIVIMFQVFLMLVTVACIVGTTLLLKRTWQRWKQARIQKTLSRSAAK